MAKTKDFWGYESDQKPVPTRDGGESPSGFLEGLRGSAGQAAVFDQMFSPNAPPLAGTIVARIGGGTLTSGVAAAMAFNRPEFTFGRDAPIHTKQPPILSGGEIYGESITAQTKGFYIAFTYMCGNVGTTANSYGECWHNINNSGTTPPRIWDTLIKPVTTGGNDFIRSVIWNPLVLDKGDEVRSVWAFQGANMNIESDTANNIYPRFGLIRLANL